MYTTAFPPRIQNHAGETLGRQKKESNTIYNYVLRYVCNVLNYITWGRDVLSFQHNSPDF